MGLNYFTINIIEISKNDNIRLWLPFVLPKSKYKYWKIIDFLALRESGSRPKGGISDEDNGEAISLGGEQVGADGSLNLSKIPYVSFDFYEKANKGKVQNNDILICKDGALTGKTCFVEFSAFPSKEVMINEHVYILRGNERINQKFLFYLTTTTLFQSQVKDLAYKKKAQPGLTYDHFKKIKIPFVPKGRQNQIVDFILPIEQKIRELKNLIIRPQDIINSVFAREFKFSLDSIYSIEGNKFSNLTDNFFYRNELIRSSYRWNKLQEIQKYLYKNNNYIYKLGKFITSTKNGWSPNCKEVDYVYAVFGIDAISKDTKMRFDNLKYTNEIKDNINDFIVKDKDLFVSRGNTVDLVAMASIVDLPENQQDIIFPDLFIKIELSEKEINKRYLAYLINSIIGRIYFKYSAKGKNQTMVKISSLELNNFYLPIPPMKNQLRIIDEITGEIEKQEKINQDIQAERNKIGAIIEQAIA